METSEPNRFGEANQSRPITVSNLYLMCFFLMCHSAEVAANVTPVDSRDVTEL